MMRRRMAQMNARMNPGGMGASSQPSGKGVPGGMPHHPTMVQGGGGMPNHANAAAGKPGSSAHPNQNVLEAVKKVVIQSLHFPNSSHGHPNLSFPHTIRSNQKTFNRPLFD